MTYKLMQPLGAAEWGWDQYEAVAVQAATAASGNFIVSLVGRNGAFTRTTPYPTRAAMLAAWDAVRIAFPADIGFGIAYDKTEQPDWRIVEQGVNPAIETVVQKKINWRKLAPYVAGGALLIAAAVYYSRQPKSKGKKAKRAARRRPLWRRRTVTVWR